MSDFFRFRGPTFLSMMAGKAVATSPSLFLRFRGRTFLSMMTEGSSPKPYVPVVPEFIPQTFQAGTDDRFEITGKRMTTYGPVICQECGGRMLTATECADNRGKSHMLRCDAGHEKRRIVFQSM